jgi:hypothetical protein
MRRRGFLGFMGGAAVAGPSMAKQALAQSVGDLSLGGIGMSYGGLGVPLPASMGARSISSASWAASNLAKLVGRSAAQHAFHRKRIQPVALDPDLASYRSMSLGARISMQRDRDYERSIEQERGYLEATIAGWFE